VSWLWSTHVAIRRFLGVITKELFPTIADIIVSEFGFAEPLEDEQTSFPAILWDLKRADYYQGFLDNILAARAEDGGLSLSSTLDLFTLMSFVGVGVTDVFGWAIYASDDSLEAVSSSGCNISIKHH